MKARVALVGCGMVLAGAGGAAAGQVRFGPQISLGTATDAGAADAGFGLGARAVVDLAEQRPGLALVASLEYFPSPEGAAESPGVSVETSYLELNANLTHTFGGRRRGRVRKAHAVALVPYVGAGVNIARPSATIKREGADDISSSETEVGLNLLGGLKLTRHALIEVRGELGGGEQLVLTVGYIF